MHPRLDDPDLSLSAMMDRWPETIEVFIRHEMLCVGCLIGPFHCLADGCRAYGLKETDLLDELFAAVEGGR